MIKLNEHYSFNVEDMLTHTAILGSTGTGKTTTLKKIINEVNNNTNIKQIIFDNKGDLKDIAGTNYINFADNLFNIKLGKIPMEKLASVIGITEMGLNILYGVFGADTKNKWHKMIGFGCIYNTVNKMSKERTFNNIALNKLLNTLETLYNTVGNLCEGIDYDFNGKLTIINVQGLSPIVYKLINLYISEMIFKDYSDESESPKLLIYIDEAHKVFKEEKILTENYETITKEYRSKGVGLVLITQHASHIPDTVLENINNFIQHGVKNVLDNKLLKKMAKMFEYINTSHEETERHRTTQQQFERMIVGLNVGECFARFGNQAVKKVQIDKNNS